MVWMELKWILFVSIDSFEGLVAKVYYLYSDGEGRMFL